jgi:hypothetical protein
MCSNCENVLIEYPFVHHPEHCPLATASYCSYCCNTGHLEIKCPSRPSIDLIIHKKPRKPLGSKSDNILPPFKRENKRYFEISKNKQVLVAFLRSQDQSYAGKIETLCKKIEAWAATMKYDGVRFVSE